MSTGGTLSSEHCLRFGLSHSPGRMGTIRAKLLVWWQFNSRDFPWRHNRDPYRVLIAELLLRRTQAAQVVPVYSRFLKVYPTLRRLAEARPQRIRTLLRPLGLRWRAENVVRLSRAVEDVDLRTLRTLRKLPGVGDYVEAAVRCFAGGHAVPVIDTNTARVAVRLFGIHARGEPRRDPLVRQFLERVVRCDNPRNVNWALLDFAAQVCRARIPICSRCPLSKMCQKTGVVKFK